MKIGILTFPNSKSFGAALQMFALYNVVKNMGNDVEIINYFNAYMKANKHFSTTKSVSRIKSVLRNKLSCILHYRQHIAFKRFENYMAKYPIVFTSKKEDLVRIGKRYNAIICGSDQVWNPDITGYDLSYLLDFCGDETERISYAPSFGVETLSDEYSINVRNELEKFSYLSIREKEGQELIKKLSGLDSELVLDPTMLMDASEWKKFETPHPKVNGEYIFYYTIRSSETLWNKCLKLAEKTNLKIIRVGYNIISKNFNKTDEFDWVCDIGPDEWLNLIHNASYVVTNSFHGTAFAINYRKNFFVEFSSLTNSRLNNIVNLFGLEKQILSAEDKDFSLVTDYSKTAMVLPIMREKSILFLKKALSNKAE